MNLLQKALVNQIKQLKELSEERFNRALQIVGTLNCSEHIYIYFSNWNRKKRSFTQNIVTCENLRVPNPIYPSLPSQSFFELFKNIFYVLPNSVLLKQIKPSVKTEEFLRKELSELSERTAQTRLSKDSFVGSSADLLIQRT